MKDACPLCGGRTQLHHETSTRRFRRCGVCALVHVPAADHVSAEEERAVYDLHENDPTDAGYRRFLRRAVDPLLEQLPPASTGLDFGCGDGPAVSALLEEAGHACADYDPLYRDEPSLLERRYDFVVATEVVEHLRAPAETLDQIFGLGARWVVLMTKRTTDAASFPGWHYHRDPTHIAFFAEATMRWLANRYGLSVAFPAADVALFTADRPPSPS